MLPALPHHEILLVSLPSKCLKYTYSQVFDSFTRGLSNIYYPQSPGLEGQARALGEDKLGPQALQARYRARPGSGFEGQVPGASGL